LIVGSSRAGLALPLLSLWAVAVLVGCGDTENATTVANDFLQGIDAPVVYGMTSYITSEGVRQARVEADTAFTFADSAKVDLRVMTVYFYDQAGAERATVRGTRGEWNQETNLMVARGDVELFVYSDSSRLRSPEIHYDPQDDRIWSDSATTRFMADGSTMSGSSFESDIEFTNIRIRDVRGDAGRIF
jgi:LPS export ABC transporter protein LptC